MVQSDFENHFTEALSSLGALLYKASGQEHIDLQECQKVMTDILRCTLSLQKPRRSLNNSDSDEGLLKEKSRRISVVKKELVEPFLCLTWSSNSFLKRSALILLVSLLDSDVWLWLEYCSPCVSYVFQSSDPSFIKFGIRYVVLRLFCLSKKNLREWLHQVGPPGQQEVDVSLVKIFVSTFTVIVEEIQMFLFGTTLAVCHDPASKFVSYRFKHTPKISRISEFRCLIEKSCILKNIFKILHESFSLFSMFNSFSWLKPIVNSLGIAYSVTFFEAALYLIIPNKVSLYIVILEMLPEWFSHRHAFSEQCLMSMMAFLGLFCYGVCFKNDSCLSPHLSSSYESYRRVAPTVTENWCSKSSWKRALCPVVCLQVLKVLATSNVKGNAVLEEFLSQCFSLAILMDHNEILSLSELYERAERLYLNGLLTSSLLSKPNKVDRKKNINHDTNASRHLCFAPHEETTAYGKDVFGTIQQQEIDVVSWLACVKTQEDVLDLIMSNFSRRAPNLSHLSSLAKSLDVSQSNLKHSIENLLVVNSCQTNLHLSSQTLNTQTLENISTEMLASLQRSFSNREQEVDFSGYPSMEDENQQDEEKACEHLSLKILPGVKVGDTISHLLRKPHDTEIVLPTSFNYLLEHHNVLQALHFQNILNMTLLDVAKYSENFSQHQLSEEGFFNHLKMEILQRLILETRSNRVLQERMASLYFEKVWEDHCSKVNGLEKCLNLSVEFLYAKYAECLRESLTINKNENSSDRHLIYYLEHNNLLELDQIFGFQLPVSNKQSSCTLSEEVLTHHLGLGKLESSDSSLHIGLSYVEFFRLIMQFVLNVPRDRISLQLALHEYLPSKCSIKKDIFSSFHSFITECPYIPCVGYQILWNFALQVPESLQMVLALLHTWINSTQKASLNRRMAYQILLRFSCHRDNTVRQSTLAFINSKIINALHYPNSECCSRKFKDSLDIQFDFFQSTGYWLEALAHVFLRLAIEKLAKKCCPSITELPYFSSWNETNTLLLYPSFQKFVETVFQDVDVEHLTCDTLQDAKDFIQRFGTLMSVLCCHHPHLLKILMHYSILFQHPLSQALYEHYLDTLHWIPKSKFNALLDLLHDHDPRYVPLQAEILWILADAVTQECPTCSVALSNLVKIGLNLYQDMVSLHLIIPLLPCLPEAESENFFKLCIQSGNLQLIRRGITRLLSCYAEQQLYPKAKSFFSPERLLWILSEYAEELRDQPEQTGLSFVFDALDHCVDLAQGPNPKFPPPLFLIFMGHSVDEFWHRSARKRLPCIFGHLLFRITLKLPSLRSLVLSDLITLLLKNSNKQHNVWSDVSAWQGLCAAVTYIWNLPTDSPEVERENSKTKKELVRMLSQLRREPLEALMNETEIQFSF